MTEKTRPLTATDLSQHYHYNCDLYLHNAHHRRQRSGSPSPVCLPELFAAQFHRGNTWEDVLLTWLDQENLLLRVPSRPTDPISLAANVEFDDRSHFFIAGLTFWPPQEILNIRFEARTEPVTFGLAKPDLIEIIRTETAVKWRVVDAKSSIGTKPSHHVQIYFYTLCLEHILNSSPFFCHEGSAAIWLPPSEGFHKSPPSFKDIKNIKMSLLSPLLDSFIFTELPNILSRSREEVRWHYNPLCHTCPYTQDCMTRTVAQGELGSMPNISLDEAQVLKTLLHASRSLSKRSKQLTDIEDLHELIAQPYVLRQIQRTSPSIVKKSRRILSLTKKVRVESSPVVEAARSHEPQIKVQRNLSCPTREDVAVVMSLIRDPSSPGFEIKKFRIDVFAPLELPVPRKFYGEGRSLVARLAFLIRAIMTINPRSRVSPGGLRTQFYVWSASEESALQAHLVDSALASASKAEDIRTCIGALAQGASLLQTKVQPTVLKSGALLGFPSRSRTRPELVGCLERMGLPTGGCVSELCERISDHVRGANECERNGNKCPELGDVPRVLVLKREVEKLIALPIPGYWDLPDCASTLLSDASCEDLHDEDLYCMLKQNTPELEEALGRRNNLVFDILQDMRKRISDSGHNLLVKEATVLRSSFMDLCRQEHLRKLFFMQQFEVLTKLDELWRSRIDGCPDSPVLQYVKRIAGKEAEHVFHVVSGTLDIPTAGRGHAMYDKIMVLDDMDDPSDDVPVEALFDDLAVAGTVFPFATNWDDQHIVVRNKLWVADIRDIVVEGAKTKVVIRAWGRQGNEFVKGCNYRISPRLVDFNTSKSLAALFEMDLRCVGGDEVGPAHYDQPLLQMILHPESFGGAEKSEALLKTENKLQSLFRGLKSLGNEAAGFLVLKSSQHSVARKILSNRLSVIWGPPGTGKTYTIALSLLRLLDVQHRHGDRSRRVIFMTAMTHAAIAACLAKLSHLINCYRSLDVSLSGWLDQVAVEQVLTGNDHPPPSRSRLVHIYAGTIYQLYNFSKRHAFEVDCVIVDEAGQLGLGSIALVLRSLHPAGRIVVAGDTEQLAPIVSGHYPRLSRMRPMFGSVLECIMATPNIADGSSEGAVVQLTENFRLNPDLGEFVSTIYSRAFKPQKVQGRQLARQLRSVEQDLLRGNNLGIRKDVVRAVQKFLLALSDVMFRKEPTLLCRPVFQYQETGLEHLPISLALIKLDVYSRLEVTYERHVRGEAAVAASLVRCIQRCCPEEDIFVATPRRIQRGAVKAALRVAEERVTVDTIERLQGSEAAFVICLFSLPRWSTTSELGFLLERRRLNVAISRAKTLCVLVTSREVLRPRQVGVLANEETTKGYAFLRAFEDRAWSCEMGVDLDVVPK